MAKIIVVGAGAAGLAAANELSVAGHEVIILEAQDRPGGRMHTMRPDHFSKAIELGAEFIHGDLPATLQLLREAGIEYWRIGGNMIRVQNGEWQKQDEFIKGWDELMQHMQEVQTDMTISDFLNTYFKGPEYKELCQSVKSFSEGFDLADIHTASLFALREEWMKEEEESQYRIPDGYSQLAFYLLQKCTQHGAVIHYDTIVMNIRWTTGNIEILAHDSKIFKGSKVLITIPLGVLQAHAEMRTSISFEPGLDFVMQQARQIGFGSVIKIFLQFNECFWNGYKKNIGFILSDEEIPVWWTQFPSNYPLLTGWLGGDWPVKWEHKTNDEILQLALKSIANIFKKDFKEIQGLVSAWHIDNWNSNIFTNGAYSFSTLQSRSAKEVLNAPVEKTIYFAGEALYSGPYPGTVEAALISGRNAAARMINDD